MVAKFWVAVVAAGVMGALTLPTSPVHAQATPPAAQPTKPAAQPTKPAAQPAAKNPAASGKSTPHKSSKSCYDYAWQSQEMNDCLAKAGSSKSAPAKSTSTKKPSTKHKQQS